MQTQEEIFELLSKKIPLTDITIANVLTAIIVIVVGYFVAIIVSKYIRKAMLKAKLAEILA